MNIPFAIVVAYVILLYLVSWYSTKLSKNSGAVGYLLAGRKLPYYIVAVTLAGIAVGGVSTVGVAERAYTQGISAGMYNAAWAMGAVIVGLVAAAKYRELNISTIPELFGRYYGNGGRIVAVIGQVILQIVITCLQYVAGGAILSALLPQYFSYEGGMLTTAIVFVGITLIGGYWAAGLTNLINVIVIYVGIIAGVIISISSVGGFSNLVAALPSGEPWFDPIAGVGLGMVLAWFIVMSTQAFSTQAVVQVSFAAKDSKTARNGYLLAGLLILPIGFIASIFGIVAAVKFPGLEKTAMALPEVVMSLNPWIAGLTLAGLWAADVSTAVGILLGGTTLIVNDIWKKSIQPVMSQKQELMASRIVVLGLGLVTYLLATTVIGILKTLLIGLSITTAYTVIVLFTLFLPKLCKKSAALWTLIVGILVLIIWQFVPSTHIVSHVIYLEWPVCIITFLLISLTDKRPAAILKENPDTTVQVPN